MNRLSNTFRNPVSGIRNEPRDLLALGLKTDAELHPDFTADILAHQPPSRARRDSYPLSFHPDYAAIIRQEKRRARDLIIAALTVLAVAVCIYLIQS